MTKVKICCMKNAAEVQLAQRAGVDAFGLVGPMPSGPGTLTLDEIAALWTEIRHLPLDSFFLISATQPADILAQYQYAPTTTIQLVDTVLPEYYPVLRGALPNTRIVQVIHVEDETAIEQAVAYQDLADGLLLDSGVTKGPARQLGGTGNIHNWGYSAEIVRQSKIPVWLAGGLKPANVHEAIRAVRPHGVDSCSGLRPGNGDLDPEALRQFMAMVGGAQA